MYKFPQFIYDYLTEDEIAELTLWVENELANEYESGYDAGQEAEYFSRIEL